jgi:diguanylate cyclase (GGDEF)-like protein
MDLSEHGVCSELESELLRSQRFEHPLALIMADLDLLRQVNNLYGHLAGDAVIQGVAGLIQEQMREYDVAGRFGGEEFAILLPETNSQEATIVAEHPQSHRSHRLCGWELFSADPCHYELWRRRLPWRWG